MKDKILFSFLSIGLYLLTAKLGMGYLAFEPGNLTVLWLPSGIALITFLKFGYQAVPIVFLSSFLANYDGLFSSANGIESWQIYTSLILSAGCDTIQPIIAMLFWRRLIQNELLSISDFYKFILFVAFIPCLFAVSLLCLNLYYFHFFEKHSFDEIIRIFGVIVFGDTIGIFASVPLYFFWRRREFDGKLSVLISLILIQTVILFIVIRYLPFLYFLSYFVVVIIGYFNRLKGVSVAVFHLYIFSIIMTKMGVGPFVYPDEYTSYIYLISFLVPFSLLAEFMTILYTSVESHQVELEKKVLERTKMLRQQIGEKNKAIDSLNISEQRLSESNKTKDKFFSIIAHDLRNPLSSYQHVTQMLIEGYDRYTDSEILELLGQISDSSDKVYQLLEHLLDWARTQTHTIPFSPKYLNLYDLARECITESGNKFRSKKISANVIGDHKTYVCADESMVRLVIRNLISNALKFTPENGNIELSISETVSHVRLACRDTGIGISEENIDKMFRIDTQFNSVGLGGERGTGLGLILCKEFISKHGGDIYAESRVNIGTTIIVNLPKNR